MFGTEMQNEIENIVALARTDLDRFRAQLARDQISEGLVALKELFESGFDVEYMQDEEDPTGRTQGPRKGILSKGKLELAEPASDKIQMFNKSFEAYFFDLIGTDLPVNPYLYECRYRRAWLKWKRSGSQDRTLLASALKALNREDALEKTYLDDREPCKSKDWTPDEEEEEASDQIEKHHNRDRAVSHLMSRIFAFMPLSLSASAMFDTEPNLGNNFYCLDGCTIEDSDRDEDVLAKDRLAVQIVMERRNMLRECRKLYAKVCRPISRSISCLQVVKAAKKAGFENLMSFLTLLNPDAQIPETSKRKLMYMEMLLYGRNMGSAFGYEKRVRYQPKKKKRLPFDAEACKERVSRMFPDLDEKLMEELRRASYDMLDDSRECMFRGVDVLDTKGICGDLSCGAVHPKLAAELDGKPEEEPKVPARRTSANQFKKKTLSQVPTSSQSGRARAEPLLNKLKQGSLVEEDFASRLVLKVPGPKALVPQEEDSDSEDSETEEAKKWYVIDGASDEAVPAGRASAYRVLTEELRESSRDKLTPSFWGFSAAPAGKRGKKGYEYCLPHNGLVSVGYLANVRVPVPPKEHYGYCNEKSRRERVFPDAFVKTGAVHEAFWKLKVSVYRTGPVSWLMNAAKILRSRGIESLSDPRLHAFSDPMRTYMKYAIEMVHGIRRNSLDPRVDICYVGSKLTDEQADQLLDAFYWRWFAPDVPTRRSMQQVLDFYLHAGWEIQFQDRFDNDYLYCKQKVASAKPSQPPKPKRTQKKKIEEEPVPVLEPLPDLDQLEAEDLFEVATEEVMAKGTLDDTDPAFEALLLGGPNKAKRKRTLPKPKAKPIKEPEPEPRENRPSLTDKPLGFRLGDNPKAKTRRPLGQ